MAQEKPKKDAQVVVTAFPPGTKVNLHERVGDYWNPRAAGKALKSGEVGKDGTATIKGLEEGARFWAVPAKDPGYGPEVAGVIAKSPEDSADRKEISRELQAQAVPQPIQARNIIVGPRSTKTTAPQVDAGPEPKVEGQTILDGSKGQDFGTKDYEQADRARYAGLSDVPPHAQRPGGSSDGRENPSYSGADGQAWGGDGSSVHRTSPIEASVEVPGPEDEQSEPKYPDEAKNRSGRQNYEEEAKPGSSTVRSDPTIKTKANVKRTPPKKSKEGTVNPTLTGSQAPASELSPAPAEVEEPRKPTKAAAKKAVAGERKQQQGQAKARKKK